MRLLSAARTDVGRKRKNNEDSFLLDEGLGLYIVADGMGGHQAGEVASRLSVATVRDYMNRFRAAKTPDADPEELEQTRDNRTISREASRLLAGIRLANVAVRGVASGQRAYRGMGCTISTLLIREDNLITANVGDSPIYLIRGGEIATVSVPHTVLAEQAALARDGGAILGEGYSHMLTRAVGADEDVRPDVSERPAQDGDIVVICSDGLSNKVTPPEIQATATLEKPERACRILTDLALERGGEDNITLIVVKVLDASAQGPGAGLVRRLFSALAGK